MKKFFTLIVLCVFSIGTIHAKITWSLSDDGTLTISGTDMPNYYNHSPWYKNRGKIKRVIIEEGVTSIGSYAFYDCNNLTNVTIPNSVTSIESFAFSGCQSLRYITIPNTVMYIGNEAFNDTKWYYTQPYGPIYIGHILYKYKEGYIPANTNIVVKEGTTLIVGSAFSGCSGLTSITIPESVINIGEKTFEGCSGLTSIIVQQGNTKYDSRSNCNAIIDKESNTLIAGCKNSVIPNFVTSIGNSAFSGCTGLVSITIPNSVTSIGNSAFYGCIGLVSITIPNSLTSIAGYAFSGCSSLSSITIPNSVTSIQYNAFSGCSGLSSVTIPNSVTSIGDRAFEKCTSLASLTIGMKKIENTFGGFKALTSVTLLDGVESIGNIAFSGCSGLTSLTIPNSVTSIGSYAFYNCSGLTSITIPNSVTSIGDGAFYRCESLSSVIIPNSVTTIGSEAFKNCSGLTSITSEAIIPPSLGFSCFYYVSESIPVYVPANSVAKYKTANGWKEFVNFREIPDNQKIADAVIAKITAIGKVEYTDACKGKIDAANKAYNALTADQKALVTNLGVLTKAQQTYETLKVAAEKLATDKAKADAVIAKITAIGKVEYTDVCKGKIDAASTAYNALTADQKALVTNLDVLNKAQQTYETLKAAAEKLAADKAKADAVIAKITAIGKVEYTDACKGKIDEANKAYNALTADQKALVTNLEVLTKAQQTYETLKAAAEKLAADKAKADVVIAKITAIGKVEYTDACKSKIDAASTAYNALTADQKALVANLDVLTMAQQTYNNLKAAAEKLAADKAKADAVIAKITAIGKVEYTDACKGKIDAASTAYNALTADQKALVTNLDVLNKAQQTYETLKAAAEKLAADKAKADAVIAKITAIGKVEYTNACKGKIDAASTAYNALTADQKALVTNLDVLNKAQQTYETLKAAAEKLAADKAKADAVIAKITAIGKVEYTNACKGKIDEANKAYNALTADQKALVTNLNVLNKAQQTYETLKAAAEKLEADKAAFNKYKSEIVAIIEALVKDDDSDAVKEIIRKAIRDIESLEYEEAISIDDNKAKVQSFVTSVNEAVENQRAEDQKTNGIEELEFAEKVNIYDLNGRKITNSMLKSGLYIRNGKKIVIK